MAKKVPTVVVAGDVTVDWFMYPIKASDEGDNWRLFDAFHADALPGGAELLTNFLKQYINEKGISATVEGPNLLEKQDLRKISPNEVIHSNAVLKNYKIPDDKDNEVLRIKKLLGYIGPSEKKLPSKLPKTNKKRANIIVLDDAGNGFREMSDLWPKAIGFSGDPIIVYKMSLPLVEGDLWNKINEKSRENLIVIINANDLRRTAGIHISKSLSWERTAKDFVFQLQKSDVLNSFNQCPYLVVLFGTEGAILYRRRNNGPDNAIIVFDPSLLEDDFASGIEGKMIGLTSIFTATLVQQLIKKGFSGLITGIKLGLSNSRALLETGYLKDNGIEYPDFKNIVKKGNTYTYVLSSIELPENLRDADPKFWRILDHKTSHIRQHVAREIVIMGKAKGLESVPICKFGEFETIDRAEIESYSSIKELIVEFLLKQKPKSPLCFAVFGPPGSGKSFCVKQIIKSIDSNGDRLKYIPFNISQFGNYQDLVNAFHVVRDISLSGKIPFVFFDEFDSAYNNQPLGWLKYFLAPMQDGEFKEGDIIHPVGKSIFVFAGGTRYTFESFVQNLNDNSSIEDPDRKFRDAKGPDFVSRLRGFINVMGPNRQGTKDDDDDAFVIRRAQLLRTFLNDETTASGLFNSKREISIDNGVLRAILNVTKYKHGTRSMKAIIEMSRLAGKNRFDLSALPVKKQLEMHVDADEFLFLTEKERYQTMLLLRDLSDPKETSFLKKENTIIESVATSMATFMQEDRNSHRMRDKKESKENTPYEEFKDAAEDIPSKLMAINQGIRKIKGKTPHTPDITDRELELLAQIEYDRLCRNRRFRGGSDNKESQICNSFTSQLTSFKDLPENIKSDFRKSIYRIPVILQKAGYEIYRLKEVEEINDPEIINRLARILHDKYIEERKMKGDTPETNSSLVEFNSLHPDLIEANFDNARTIPEKLKSIGYDIMRLQRGNENNEIKLTKEEIEEMAKMEHSRWVWQKIMQGWVYKEGDKDPVMKTSPYIVPWEKLEPDIQDNDRNTVSLIPKLLKEAGYEAYKPDPEKNTEIPNSDPYETKIAPTDLQSFNAK